MKSNGSGLLAESLYQSSLPHLFHSPIMDHLGRRGWRLREPLDNEVEQPLFSTRRFELLDSMGLTAKDILLSELLWSAIEIEVLVELPKYTLQDKENNPQDVRPKFIRYSGCWLTMDYGWTTGLLNKILIHH